MEENNENQYNKSWQIYRVDNSQENAMGITQSYPIETRTLYKNISTKRVFLQSNKTRSGKRENSLPKKPLTPDHIEDVVNSHIRYE